ncbi:hypothetical protein SPURM210S_07969 [Streptomyces purpurascens]
MRSHFAARPARLALAAVAALALTATATAASASAADSRGSAARACGTKDLTFKLTTETQAGGYFLVTARPSRASPAT